MRRIELITAASYADEAALLRELPALCEQSGAEVVPVIAHGELPSRIFSVLQAYGVQVSSAPARARIARQDAEQKFSRRPGLLIVSNGVDKGTTQLASALCRCAPCRLPLSRSVVGRQAPAANRSALFLLNPEATPASLIQDTLATLESEGIIAGLALALDPISARFAVLKSLLVDEVSASGSLEFIGELARGGNTRQRFEQSHDVMVVTGHANALDASIGDELIVCARAGNLGAAAAAGVLPCFNDGHCFRQRRAARELVGIQRAAAKILVLAGCNLAPLGKAWFQASTGLVHQASQGAAAAVIAATVESVGSFELDLLCAALIAEGLPLGAVVREINRVRREERLHSTGLPPDVGPFVLIGNPLLHLTHFPMQTAACVPQTAPERSSSSRFLVVPQPGPGAGPLVRCTMPTSADPPFLWHDASNKPEYRGIWHGRADDAVLYLWLPGSDGEPLPLGCADHDPWVPARRAVAQIWAEVPFWMLFLDEHSASLQRRGLPVDELESLLAELPAWARFLSTAGLSLGLVPGEVAATEAKLALCSALWKRIHLWYRALLQTLIEIRCEGALHSYGTSPYYQLKGISPIEERCYCGQGTVTGQGFFGLDGRQARVVYQCGSCGTVTDEDGQRRLRVTEFTGRVERNGRLSCTCDITTTDGAHLHVHAVLVLETWASGRRLVGAIYQDALLPDTRTAIPLHVDVPDDLTPGAYPASVIGLLNGSLYVIRRMIQIC